MKKMIAGLIGGVFFAGLFLGTAAASGDEYGEYGEYGEHGRYYNPYYNNGNVRLYGNGYYNNGYRNHEMYEYNDDDYRYRGTGRVYGNPYSNSGYYNNGYRNHEAYEYGGYRR